MSDRSGIYKITNDINGKIYIGSSTMLKRRKWDHFNKLSAGKHGNSHLQNAYDKYGKEHFHFDILEYIDDVEKLIERENYWIREFRSNNSEFGYNIREDAQSNLGFKHSEETKAKISKNSASKPGELSFSYGRTFVMTEEHKKRISESNMGRICSEETRKKISESNKGKVRSEETKKKISETKKGEKKSEETKRNMSAAQKRRTWTEENRQWMLKIRAMGGGRKKKILSEEEKLNIEKEKERKWLEKLIPFDAYLKVIELSENGNSAREITEITGVTASIIYKIRHHQYKGYGNRDTKAGVNDSEEEENA